MGNNEKKVTDFIFLGSKISADGDYSHEIKRHLLLGRKAMTNQDSIFKSINSLALSLFHSPTVTYMTTGKTIALARRIFVGKVMSLLFNMLSRLVITFLPRSKHLLISWLQSPSAVILESRKIKSATVSSSICHEGMGQDAMLLVFWMEL